MPDYKYQVFLSHSSPDKPAVEELAVRLKKEGLEPWLDKWNLVPGEAWQPALERALAVSASCAVFIGPGGFGAWQDEEMRAAISRRVSDTGQSFRVIPVLLPTAERPDRSKLPTFLVASTWVEFRKSLDDDEAFRRFLCGIRGLEPGAGEGGAAFEGQCPYRGLEAFDVEHAPFFFGREALTEWLVDAIRPRLDGREHRFLAILGASGSGKSSLARAGLMAALRRGALEGSASWPSAILKPGRDPVESLAVALAGLGGASPALAAVQATIAGLKSDEKTLHLAARLALRDAPATSRLVVLVDQCEEAFTTCDDDAARTAFFDNLLYAATVADGRTIVVLTMRADFYGKCALHPALAAAMSDNQLLVGPMARDELRSAIERPSALAGGEFEPGLVEILLQDVDGQPGSLPLLQFALMELWQRREGRRLTVAAYKALGELQGALRNRADDVLNQFDEAHREICRRIFLRLTQPGEGSEDTKRRASFGELVPAGAEPMAVEAVVRRLADARLITTEGDPRTGGPVSVEVAHEALIRGWGRLRQWIDADRAGLRLHRQISEAAREWQAGGREGSFLLGGSRLVVALEWARTHGDQLDAQEKAFLDAGRRRRLLGRAARAASVVLVLGSLVGAREWIHWQAEADFRKQAEAVDVAMKEAARLAEASDWKGAIEKLTQVDGQLGRDARFAPLHSAVGAALAKYQGSRDEADLRDKVGLVDAAMKEATHLAGESNWAAAIAELKAVEGQLRGDARYKDLRTPVEAALDSFSRKDADRKARDRDAPLIKKLEEARAWGVVSGGLADSRKVADLYRKAFREFEIDIDRREPSADARRIEDRPPDVRERLAAAIDDWTGRVAPPEDARLRAIACAVDPEPWRVAIRKALTDHDAASLRRRADDPGAVGQPARTLALLGSALSGVGEYNRAVTLLRKAQHQRPGDFAINLTLADALMRANPPRYDEATRYYAIAVALVPESSGANSQLGIALSGLMQFDETIFYMTRAIEIDPTSNLAYHWRGHAWFEKHDYDRTIADSSRAIELDPNDTFAYSNRGGAYMARREYDKAIADFTSDVDRWPKALGSFINRGICRAAKHEYDKAIADYDRAIAGYGQGRRPDGDYVLAHLRRGEAHLARHEAEAAIADFTEVIRLQPGNSYAHYRRGTAQQARHEHRKAIEDFDAAIRSNPRSSEAYNDRAWLLATCPEEGIRDGKKAVESATRACELTGWGNAHHLDTLAAAYAEAGDFDAAVKWQEKAAGLLARGEPASRPGVEERLVLYRAKKPYRTPGRPTDAKRPG